MKIPEMMNVVQLEAIGGPFVVRSVKVPEPRRGEVLVKIAASPVNPSDLARIRNLSTGDLMSFIPGLEGSGTVVKAGEGQLPRLWLGKRVACSAGASGGTWAEFMVTSASHCFPLPAGISDEQGSMMLVNPMTAVAFFDTIVKDKHTAIVNSAAAGALGGMIRLLAVRHNVAVINVVRNDRQVSMLQAEGARYVLNNSDEDFADKLKILTHELRSTLALDPIGGAYTQKLLEALPYGSVLIIYGNLSDNVQGPSLRPLLLENKKIHGFYLANWMKENTLLKAVLNLRKVRNLLSNDFKITVQNRFSLDQTQLAIDTYLSNMTAGKVLLLPGKVTSPINTNT
jgi:NADPH:quinone reductase-like Zn-dependent oxidoreductase